MKETYCYLIEDIRDGSCKIGKSNDPQRRYNTLKTGNPSIKLIGVNRLREDFLHKKYLQFRTTGEWFNFTEEIKKEVYELFRPLQKENYIEINTDYDYLLNKFMFLYDKKKYKQIVTISNLIYKSLGRKEYCKIFKKDKLLYNYVTSSMLMNL
jgi:hypothetical protein